MTDNTQELDDILEDFYDGDIRQSDMGKAKQAILDWHKKRIEAMRKSEREAELWYQDFIS